MPASLYDHAVDPNTALHALRLDPSVRPDAATVEAAYAREAVARHPSRYPDADGRRAAEAWALTLAEARSTLLRSIGTTDAAAWVPPVEPPRPISGPFAPTEPTMATAGTTAVSADAAGPAASAPATRRRRGLVLGIFAASIGAVVLFVGAGIGATRFAEQLIERTSDTGGTFASDAPADVERFSVDEAAFTFPAALEMYNDWRYDDRCPAEFTLGCWQSAVITEASCASLQVDLEFSDDGETWITQARDTISVPDVTAGAITPVVFGHDDYDYGWIADVRCMDDAVTDGAASS
jgi:hypothetical protein